MHTAISSSLGVVAYLALFAGIGLLFVFVNLLVGKFLRPADPHAEKTEIYECGEPAIGSSFVQFDLRFYVVALIFIIFDVEVAFLFPWATVFGKADHLADTRFAVVRSTGSGELELTPAAKQLYQELGVVNPTITQGANAESVIREGGRSLMVLAIAEGLVFFVVLLIAFAYEWKIGALDWVRSVTAQTSARVESLDIDVSAAEPALSA